MSKTTGSGRTQRNNPYQLEELFMTSDAVKLSSCLGDFLRGGGKGDGLVVVLAGCQAVPEAAEQAAE